MITGVRHLSVNQVTSKDVFDIFNIRKIKVKLKHQFKASVKKHRNK